MVFSSVIFIGVFLPVFFVFYFLSKSLRLKNIVLVAFSLFFYAWGEPVWILALIFSGLVDYTCGLVIGRHFHGWQAKAAVAASLTINLSLLGMFKYSGFIIENINLLLNLSIAPPSFNLPLGISFYTFQTISYTLDVYRGDTKTQKSFLTFLAYVTMFPQLVAGPIVRYSDIEEQVYHREITFKGFSDGISRFAIGLGKKVLLANSAGSVVKFLLDDSFGSLSMLSAWLGLLMFTFQIYFDFSGYSDMAIGLGKMIGFDFKENFNYPYISKSISDFWRRWHMSLSTFFRDYLYIPLGGNRRHYVRNIAIVWFLTGLWHGASWNFILWGLYFGVIIILEKYFILDFLERLPSFVSHVYSLALIIFGWALFYFTDLTRLGSFLRSAFNFSNIYDFKFSSAALSHLILIIALIIGSTPLPAIAARKLVERFASVKYMQIAVNSIIVVTCFLLLMGDTFNPFLYFRF